MQVRYFSRFVGLALLSLLLVAPSANAREVSLCSENWRPWVGADLRLQGFHTQLVRAAFDRKGYDTSVAFMDWEQAKQRVRSGQCDFLISAYYTKERAEQYHVSNTVNNVNIGFVTHERTDLADSPILESVEVLADYRVGVTKRYRISKDFHESEAITPREYADPRKAVKDLYQDDRQVLAGSFARLLYAARQEGLDASELVFLHPVRGKEPLHIMGSRAVRDTEEILSDFEEGVRELQSSGDGLRILEELGYAFPPPERPKDERSDG